MKIIRNIPQVIKIYRSLKYLNEYKKEIDSGRISGDIKKEKENILKATKTWGSKLSEMIGVEITVSGIENLPEKSPVVYVSNHQGYADIVVLCAVLDTVQFGFIAKNGLEKVPLYGTWIKRIRSILIERDDPRESLKAISRGIDYINLGFSLLIFPEGTRSRGPVMGDFKKGSLKLATKPQVPIIPVSINDTWHIYEETGIVTPHPVRVMIHPAIETASLDKEQEKALTEKVRAVINKGLDELKKDS